MGKSITLRLQGNLSEGFQATLSIRERGQDVTEASGRLPAAQALLQTLEHWQKSYRQCLGNSRLGPISTSVEPGSLAQLQACRQGGEVLQQQFSQWLLSDGFRPIDQRLREALLPDETAELLLRCDDRRLHHLPWHHWDFIERYPNLEMVFGSPPQQLSLPQRPPGPLKILAILGNTTTQKDVPGQSINVTVDQELLTQLPQAEVTSLVEPSRRELDQQLWETPWDILFFAGHSHSQTQQGYLNLNSSEQITLEELRYGLQRAIANGLRLAIFNSCDGLGLAYALEQLHLPQLIVMGEPVPDLVAQQFLSYFLSAFSQGKNLPLALREARERLQSLENEYPFASWLPVLFHNPATPFPTWQSFQGITPAQPEPVPQASPKTKSGLSLQSQASQLKTRYIRPLVLSIALSLGIITGRSLGLIQTLELASFDHLLRLRPSEPEDDRILIVEVTQADIDAQPAAERQGRSLSDATLNQLLDILNAAEPTAIGLDIYRDAPTDLAALNQKFATNDRLIAVCKGQDSDRNVPGIAPPAGVTAERLGFSDAQSDRDGIVRLHLLAAVPLPESPCTTDYSLSAALAYSYLNSQNIALEFPDNHTWQWGEAKFRRIGAGQTSKTFVSYGPYHQLNAQGHKLLLNYRTHQKEANQPKTPLQAFPRLSLGRLLSGDINQASLANKIVLVGVTAEESGDRWTTPYRNTHGQALDIPGVHLQAQMTSQLLSTVLQERSLLHAWPWIVEAGLICLGGAIAALISASLGRQPRWHQLPVRLLLGLLLLCTGLYGLTVIAMIRLGLYLPLIPTSLAVLLSGIGTQRLQSLSLKPRAKKQLSPKSLKS